MEGFDTYGNFYASTRNANALTGQWLGVSTDTATYEPYHVLSSISSSDGYAYGFNGQIKVNEWAGSGNWNTALFWEYIVRTTMRLNKDPKGTAWESPYSTFKRNPIWFSDVKGDTIITNQEGAANTLNALKGILNKGQKNPVTYDKITGRLNYNNDVDISKYSDIQKQVFGNLETLINSEVNTTLKIVDREDNFLVDGVSTNLDKLGANGYTHSGYDKLNGNVVFNNVYVARKPIDLEGQYELPEYAYTVNLHELAGHAYFNYINPGPNSPLQMNANNKSVELMMNKIFKIFKVEGTIWYKGRKAKNHDRYEKNIH